VSHYSSKVKAGIDELVDNVNLNPIDKFGLMPRLSGRQKEGREPMSVLKRPVWIVNLLAFFHLATKGKQDYRLARDLVRSSYKKSGGATPELKRVYRAYKQNQEQRGA
jgi:hypothetical protein